MQVACPLETVQAGLSEQRSHFLVMAFSRKRNAEGFCTKLGSFDVFALGYSPA
jgi:hypothetical protein